MAVAAQFGSATATDKPGPLRSAGQCIGTSVRRPGCRNLLSYILVAKLTSAPPDQDREDKYEHGANSSSKHGIGSPRGNDRPSPSQIRGEHATV